MRDKTKIYVLHSEGLTSRDWKLNEWLRTLGIPIDFFNKILQEFKIDGRFYLVSDGVLESENCNGAKYKIIYKNDIKYHECHLSKEINGSLYEWRFESFDDEPFKLVYEISSSISFHYEEHTSIVNVYVEDAFSLRVKLVKEIFNALTSFPPDKSIIDKRNETLREIKQYLERDDSLDNFALFVVQKLATIKPINIQIQLVKAYGEEEITIRRGKLIRWKAKASNQGVFRYHGEESWVYGFYESKAENLNFCNQVASVEFHGEKLEHRVRNAEDENNVELIIAMYRQLSDDYIPMKDRIKKFQECLKKI